MQKLNFDPKGASERGLTLVENMVAIMVVAILLESLFVLGSQCMKITDSGRQATQASLAISDRIEVLRNLSWPNMTSSNYLRTNVMNTLASGSQRLSSPTETITINVYPTALTPPITVTRNGTTTTVVSTNAAVANANMARVDVSVAWTGPGGRSRTQATSTIVARVNR